MRKFRVIHVGTGPTGTAGLVTILNNSSLELVGQFVSTPEKIGQDSGILAGLGAVGIKATNHWDELLALKADCLCYMGNGSGREDEVTDEVCRFLEAGTNAVSISLIPMVFPPSAPAAMRDRIAAACEKGGTTFYNSGIDPGFATTQLPVALGSIAGRIETVLMSEISVYGEYPVVPIMTEIFGFGRPLDFDRPLFKGGVTAWWDGTVRAVAERLSIPLDEVRPVYEVATHDVDIATAFGDVPAGTTAGIRFRVEGLVKDKPVVILEHVSRAHDDVAPHWPRSKGGAEHQYGVFFQGDPSFDCILDFPPENGALKWTANHAANAIEAVCLAQPGIRGPFDLAYHGRFVSPSLT